MTVPAARRSADSDEYDLCTSNGRGQLSRKRNSSGPRIALYQIGKSGLENRNLTASQRLDLSFIEIDADNVVPEIGEACAGNEADIPGSDHCDLHRISTSLFAYERQGTLDVLAQGLSRVAKTSN